MKCSKCKRTLKDDEYYPRKDVLDQYRTVCKACKWESDKIRMRTETGRLRTMYKSQRCNSRKRNHPLPDYTFNRWSDWCYMQGYKKLYDAWVASDYDEGLTPSGDRLDNNKPYTFNNLQLVTWRINADRHCRESQKPVMQRNTDGDFVMGYKSVTDASVKTGISLTNISGACNGRNVTAGGYIWHFVDVPYVHKVITRPNMGGVIRCTRDDVPVERYDTLDEAAGFVLSIPEYSRSPRKGVRGNIASCRSGKKKVAYGFVWKKEHK